MGNALESHVNYLAHSPPGYFQKFLFIYIIQNLIPNVMELKTQLPEVLLGSGLALRKWSPIKDSSIVGGVPLKKILGPFPPSNEISYTLKSLAS